MDTHQYFIECEQGYDTSHGIKSVLEKTNYSIDLKSAHSTHWFYKTQRRLTKRITEKIRSVIGVREIRELTDLV